MNLNGRVVLVTGAAHRIGRAIALSFAQQGAQIALHYGASKVAARQTAGEFATLGFNVEIFHAELSDSNQIDKLFSQVEKQFGKLDVLVNSAASFQSEPIENISPDEWDAVLAVNLRAPFLASQHAAKLMRASARDLPALILNIADLSGIHPWVGHAHHGVSKAGLIHLTRTLARELAPDIRANAIIPGAILPPPDVDFTSDEWQQIIERNLLRRTGTPEDVGRTAVFLAESDFITGAIVPVDGGESLLGPVGH